MGIHQHLHGCVRIATIRKQAGATLSQPLIVQGGNRVEPAMFPGRRQQTPYPVR